MQQTIQHHQQHQMQHQHQQHQQELQQHTQEVPIIQRAPHYNSNGNLSTRSAGHRRNSSQTGPATGQQLNHNIDNNLDNGNNGFNANKLSKANDTNNTTGNSSNNNNNNPATTPICRCRVMYLGSSVPHVTKDGLQGIQEPLRDLYPDPATLMSGNAGIDSWLSVWSNGILLENIDDNGREMKRFFQIDSLHYCAAVRYVLMNNNNNSNGNNNGNQARSKTPNSAGNNNTNEVPSSQLSNCQEDIRSVQEQQNIYSTTNSINGLDSDNTNYSKNTMAKHNSKFLPLDSPYSRNNDLNSPPIFACILRRTTGIKVLECHAFICKREAAANALVRCCFHAYADTMYAKQMGADISAIDSNNNNLQQKTKKTLTRKSKSTPGLADTVQMVEAWRSSNNDDGDDDDRLTTSSQVTTGQMQTDTEETSRYGARNGSRTSSIVHHREFDDEDENSVGECSVNESAISNMNRQHAALQMNSQQPSRQHRDRKLQNKLSKSMHHLNSDDFNAANNSRVSPYSNGFDIYNGHSLHSTSCADINNAITHPNNWTRDESQMVTQIPGPINGPYTSRVPSYPAQSMINGVTGHSGGTLRSIKSLAANSIASTLLKSKRHAKAMSTSSSHISPEMLSKQVPMMMGPHGPIPMLYPMPIPQNISTLRSQINGSQTLRPPSRPMVPVVGGPPSMPPLSSKELKKLIKKGAKLGLDPTKFGTTNMIPTRPGVGPMIPPQQQLISQNIFNNSTPIPVNNGYDTRGDTLPNFPRNMPAQFDNVDSGQSRGRFPIMAPVRPSPEFLKSKEGKKWFKQQKELKKLLPPHLGNLPIVLGAPPPLDGEPILSPNMVHFQPSPLLKTSFISHAGQQMGMTDQGIPIPTMDSSGYYNPHPFYGANTNGNSTSNTMMRYSPSSEYIKNDSGQISRRIPHHIENAVDQTRFTHQQQFFDQNDGQNFIGENSSINFSNVGDSDSYYGADQTNRYPPRYRVPMRQPVMNYPHEEMPLDLHEKQYSNMNGDPNGASSSRSVHSYKTSKSRSSSKSRLNSDDQHIMNQSDYANHRQPLTEQQEQMLSSTDDQNSYSSGIYKKGHINERAFSYSILQEHRSRGDLTNIDFANNIPCEDVPDDVQQHYRRDYQQLNAQRHHANENQQRQNGFVHYNGVDDQQKYQAMSVNELSARLEHQMNMRSFKSKSRSRERL